MGSEDRTAKLWDLSSGQQLREFQGHTLRVFRAVFSPDGTRLATSSSDGTAKVWDVATGQAQFTLSGHTGGVQVAYSLDGSRLATSAIGAAKVWDASTGRELLSLSIPSGWGTRVAFSPDGARLAVASTDTSVHIYLLHLDDLVKLAHARLTRSWTVQECQQFLHLGQCPG